jgi:hypothetical protein
MQRPAFVLSQFTAGHHPGASSGPRRRAPSSRSTAARPDDSTSIARRVLGSLEIFIVPIACDATRTRYQAIFN